MLDRFLDRFRGYPPLPDGFIKGDKRDTYRVDPIYIEADRTFQEMPVKPEYEILTGLELLDAPHIVTGEETAANPRNPKLPTLPQLLDKTYYLKQISPKLRSRASIDARDVVTCPIELRPAAGNVFIFPIVEVQHVQAIQTLGEKRNRLEIMGPAIPQAVRDGKLISDEIASDLEGLAFVTHVRVPLDLRQFFTKPADLKRAKGGLSVRDVTGKSIVRDVFKDKLEAIGEKVSEVRNKPVRGILLSPITVNWRLADAIMMIQTDPQGELIIAASYLV